MSASEPKTPRRGTFAYRKLEETHGREEVADWLRAEASRLFKDGNEKMESIPGAHYSSQSPSKATLMKACVELRRCAFQLDQKVTLAPWERAQFVTEGPAPDLEFSPPPMPQDTWGPFLKQGRMMPDSWPACPIPKRPCNEILGPPGWMICRTHGWWFRAGYDRCPERPNVKLLPQNTGGEGA